MAGPPRALISRLVQRIVVAIAQRHGELVRHLETERPLLRETNMVRLRGAAAAHEARLAGNEGEVRLIADALVFGDENSPVTGAGCVSLDGADSVDEAGPRVR